jgi:hypothetical protein
MQKEEPVVCAALLLLPERSSFENTQDSLWSLQQGLSVGQALFASAGASAHLPAAWAGGLSGN